MSTQIPPAMKPTGARHWVIVFAIFLAMICYLDRIILSQAAPIIQDQLSITKKQMSWVFALFTLAYAIFEIPGGWMGDKWGPRVVLMRVVVWWSFCTVALGSIWNSFSLMVINTMFGAGEAGCFPNLTKTFKTWLPRNEQVRAQGLMWFSARFGGAITPLCVALVLRYLDWRWAFRIIGCSGIIWAFFFYRWYRNNPADHKSVNAAELAIIPIAQTQEELKEPVPWKLIFLNPSVCLLGLQYFLISYSWWFYITWLPTYMKEARGFLLQKEAVTGAILAGLPLLLGALGCMLAGFITPWLVKKIGNIKLVRRSLGFTGFFGASCFVFLSIQLQHPVWAMIALGFAGFANDLTIPGSWATCMDKGGRFSGTLSGSMNMMGSFGGFLAGLSAGYILAWTNNNWNVPLYMISIVYLLGSLCWIGIDPVTPLIAADAKKEEAAG